MIFKVPAVKVASGLMSPPSFRFVRLAAGQPLQASAETIIHTALDRGWRQEEIDTTADKLTQVQTFVGRNEKPAADSEPKTAAQLASFVEAVQKDFLVDVRGGDHPFALHPLETGLPHLFNDFHAWLPEETNRLQDMRHQMIQGLWGSGGTLLLGYAGTVMSMPYSEQFVGIGAALGFTLLFLGYPNVAHRLKTNWGAQQWITAPQNLQENYLGPYHEALAEYFRLFVVGITPVDNTVEKYLPLGKFLSPPPIQPAAR